MEKETRRLISVGNGFFVEEKTLATKIATYIFVTTSNETNTGNWLIYEHEIEEDLGLPKGTVRLVKDKIFEELTNGVFGEMISYLNIEEDGNELAFDTNLYDSFICGFIQDDACFEN